METEEHVVRELNTEAGTHSRGGYRDEKEFKTVII